jgi:hypothetical protein
MKSTGSDERARRKAEREWLQAQERKAKRLKQRAKKARGPSIVLPAGAEAAMQPGSCQGRRPG